jgi:hypothetical protein
VVTDELDRRLPGSVEATAYFVAAEALTNAIKHSARAGSTCGRGSPTTSSISTSPTMAAAARTR